MFVLLLSWTMVDAEVRLKIEAYFHCILESRVALMLHCNQPLYPSSADGGVFVAGKKNRSSAR